MLMPTPLSPFRLDLSALPRNLEALRAAVERQRGRRLILEPAFLSHSGSAIWIATHEADLIVYDQAAEPARRLQAICHQFGHMLLGHQGRRDRQRTLFPHLDVTAATTVPITGYTHHDELEADDFAAFLVTRVTRSSGFGDVEISCRHAITTGGLSPDGARRRGCPRQSQPAEYLHHEQVGEADEHECRA
jgi:hypothetical protein